MPLRDDGKDAALYLPQRRCLSGFCQSHLPLRGPVLLPEVARYQTRLATDSDTMGTTDLMASTLRILKSKGVWMKTFAVHKRHQTDDVLEDLWQALDGGQTSETMESSDLFDTQALRSSYALVWLGGA